MSPPDRHPVPAAEKPPAPLPAALRQDGTAPRTPAQRLLMLCILVAISLSVAIPTLVVTRIFGQRPGPKTPPPVAQALPAPRDRLWGWLRHSMDWLRPGPPTAPPPAATATPTPGDGLLLSLQRSADQLLPTSQSLGPDPITIPVRPEHVAARLEKVRRQAAQFGGTVTEGVPSGNEKHLFVDLPVAATAAFRLAVTTNSPADASPTPPATASPSIAAGSQDHIEVIIRPAGDDE